MGDKDRLQVDKKSLILRAIGISNIAVDKETNKKYSIQFYDLDMNKGFKYTREIGDRILEIFPYDLILYRTKHGLHFISFALLNGLYTTKARVLETTKAIGLETQDYWTPRRDLTLRVSGKWKVKRFSKKRLTISKKPKFERLLKSPNKYRISKNHLEFYYKNMGLPEDVYHQYDDCDKKDYSIKIYHYKTRD